MDMIAFALSSTLLCACFVAWDLGRKHIESRRLEDRKILAHTGQQLADLNTRLNKIENERAQERMVDAFKRRS